MVYNSTVLKLVSIIEQGYATNQHFQLLVLAVQQSLKNFQPQRDILQSQKPTIQPYPIVDGYALSFDPVTQSQEFLEYWYKYGFVVGKDVVSSEVSNNVVKKILSIINTFDIQDESTYLKDSNHTPILSRGFFELYHDDTLAQIRQSVRLYLHYCLIWNTPYLWTSFDRLGLKTPQGESATGLGLHVDQNPTVHSEFTTVQGVLALEDCPVERGTFVVVPGSRSVFKEYSQFINPSYKGEYVNLEESRLKDYLEQHKQCIPLRKNNLVSWDSRTTHANSSNISNINRYVCYVSMGIAQENRQDLIDKRLEVFKSGLGENVRDAYLHASKKPRFTDIEYINKIREKENLTQLGQWLYGFKKYKEINTIE